MSSETRVFYKADANTPAVELTYPAERCWEVVARADARFLTEPPDNAKFAQIVERDKARRRVADQSKGARTWKKRQSRGLFL